MDSFEVHCLSSALEDLNELLREIVKALPATMPKHSEAPVEKAVSRLKTLEEHNDAILNKDREGSRPNGIACPECAKELVDTNPSVTLTSNPPQKRVSCKNCGWAGTRFC